MKEEGFATAVQPDIQETSAPVVPKEYRCISDCSSRALHFGACSTI